MRLPTLAAVCAVIALCLPVNATAPSLTTSEQLLANAVNSARVRNDRTPLAINLSLQKAARDHSVELARNNLFTHDFKRDGVSYPFAKWINWYYSGCLAGENIVWNTKLSDQTAVRLWLHSPEHRANLLSSEYTQMGVSIIRAKKKTIAVNEFGRPCPGSP